MMYIMPKPYMNPILHIALRVEYVKYSITKAAKLDYQKDRYPQALLLASNHVFHENCAGENIIG